MSMLAEQRRKQKYSTDPRGMNWSRDETKIGQKLMEKMGWSKGKGLGANENGNTEHVAVRFKGDNLGVGCSKKHADNWIAHQDDFDSLLSSLNQDYKTPTDSGTEDNVKVQSLEEKSKIAKGRVHYRKFAKGKDLSRCQGDDMDCIMGKRKSKSGTSTPLSEAISAADSEPEEEPDYGVQTFTSNTSVQDYFAKKMAEIKRLRAGNLDAQTSENESKEKKENQHDSCSSNSDTQSKDENLDRKKSKKKAKKKKLEKENSVETSEIDEDENLKVSSEKKSKKKSKKRKLSDTENTDTEEPSKKKKKSKKEKREEVEEDSEVEPKKKKKKSKKNKKSDVEEEEIIDTKKPADDEVKRQNDNTVKGILKKNKPKVDLGFNGANILDISGYGENVEMAPVEESPVSVKKSKNKKKKKR